MIASASPSTCANALREMRARGPPTNTGQIATTRSRVRCISDGSSPCVLTCAAMARRAHTRRLACAARVIRAKRKVSLRGAAHQRAHNLLLREGTADTHVEVVEPVQRVVRDIGHARGVGRLGNRHKVRARVVEQAVARREEAAPIDVVGARGPLRPQLVELLVELGQVQREARRQRVLDLRSREPPGRVHVDALEPRVRVVVERRHAPTAVPRRTAQRAQLWVEVRRAALVEKVLARASVRPSQQAPSQAALLLKDDNLRVTRRPNARQRSLCCFAVSERDQIWTSGRERTG
eukprot:2993702-Prymnesium_polylepis.1